MIATKRINKSLKDESTISYNMCNNVNVKYFADAKLRFLYFNRKWLHQSIRDISSNKKAIDHAFFNYIMCRFRKINKPLGLY